MKYDLEERTTKFAEEIIALCRQTQKNIITIPNIGCNYLQKLMKP